MPTVTTLARNAFSSAQTPSSAAGTKITKAEMEKALAPLAKDGKVDGEKMTALDLCNELYLTARFTAGAREAAEKFLAAHALTGSGNMSKLSASARKMIIESVINQQLGAQSRAMSVLNMPQAVRHAMYAELASSTKGTVQMCHEVYAREGSTAVVGYALSVCVASGGREDLVTIGFDRTGARVVEASVSI